MVQSVDRAISILKCFNERKKELKLSEISDELGINKSTVHGIINTLKMHGFIDQDEKTQKYRLGLYLIGLGEIVVNSLNEREIGYPIIENVCQMLDETVHVLILDHTDVVYVDKKECDNSIKVSTKIGSRNPAYCLSGGKVILAYLDRKKQEESIPNFIPKHTPNTINDKTELFKELDRIKERGYAIDNEEYQMGIVCVATPVFDHLGEIKYSIAITAPKTRMTEEKIEKSIKILKDASDKISYEMGYRKNK